MGGSSKQSRMQDFQFCDEDASSSPPTIKKIYKCVDCKKEYDNKQSYCSHRRHCQLKQKGMTAWDQFSEEQKHHFTNLGKLSKKPRPLCLICSKQVKELNCRFCSSTCYGIYLAEQQKGHLVSDRTKAKISQAVIEFNIKNGSTRKTINCLFCSLPFLAANKARKYCSRRCAASAQGLKTKGKPNPYAKGGLREGSGRSKSGWYKGYYCNSTYELIFLAYHLEKGSNICRSTDVLPYWYKDKICRYHPDFKIDKNTYEIKGYLNEKAKAKHEQYPNIVLVKKEEIQRLQQECSLKGLNQNQLVAMYD